MITLYFIDNGILDKPTLYLSDFIEKNKGTYFDSLTMVRESNDLDQWIRFFLVCIKETAQNGKKTFEKIIKLREKSQEKLLSLGRRARIGHKFLTVLFSSPDINSKRAEKENVVRSRNNKN